MSSSQPIKIDMHALYIANFCEKISQQISIAVNYELRRWYQIVDLTDKDTELVKKYLNGRYTNITIEEKTQGDKVVLTVKW